MRTLVAVTTLLAALVAAAPAAAQAPSLTGEDFLARAYEGLPIPDIGEVDIVAAQCNEDGSGSFTFTASGTAVGPYPGTFRESGSFTFGPGEHGQADVTDFQASFTIDSADGQVTGTKTLLETASSTGCRVAEDERFFAGAALATYEATIVLPSGARCTDSGTAEVSATLNDFGEQESENFSEVFQSAQGAATCPPTSREECGDDPAGFKNRGDCVAYFATEAKNEPGRNLPGVP